MKRARRGFTLVEVICVLTIMAIIAAIAIPNISGYIKKSKQRNCENVMKTFVNDLEYKIVSKRFYDLNELNNDLVNVVRSYADTVVPENPGPGQEIKAKGICPNGGEYTIKWNITPDTSANDTDRYGVSSATVALGINAEGHEYGGFVCDCMGDNEDNVFYETGDHSFKAALVVSNYVETSTPEEAFRVIILNTIDSLKGQIEDPAGISDIINEYNANPNNSYKIAGATVKKNGSSADFEWLSMYYEADYNQIDNTVNFYRFFTASAPVIDAEHVIPDDISITDLSGSDFENDFSKWPPAEGTAGSNTYKKCWNSASGDNHNKNFVVAVSALKDNRNNYVNWIQRDGNWYVQENYDVKGVAANEMSGLLASEKKLMDIEVSINPGIKSTVKDAFQIKAYYEDGKEPDYFSVMESYKTENNIYNKNGFVIVSDLDVLMSYGEWVDWTGVFSNVDLSENVSDTYDEIVGNQADTIEKITNNSINEFYVAYQEYYKSVQSVSEDGTVKYNAPELVTRYQTVTLDSPYTEPKPPVNADTVIKDYPGIRVTDDGNIETVVEIKMTATKPGEATEKLSVPVYKEIPVLGSDNNSDYTVTEDSGKNEIVFNGYDTPVRLGSITYEYSNYHVGYNKSDGDTEFNPDKLTVSADVILKVTDLNNNETKASLMNSDISRMTSSDGSGYYFSDTNSFSDDTETIQKIISGKNGNDNSFSTKIRHHEAGKPDTEIGTIKSSVGIKCDYAENTDDDTTFGTDNIAVKKGISIEIKDSYMTTSVDFSKNIPYRKVDDTGTADKKDEYYYLFDWVKNQPTDFSKISDGTTVDANVMYHAPGTSLNSSESLMKILTDYQSAKLSYSGVEDSSFIPEHLSAEITYSIKIDDEKISDVIKFNAKKINSGAEFPGYYYSDDYKKLNDSSGEIPIYYFPAAWYKSIGKIVSELDRVELNCDPKNGPFTLSNIKKVSAVYNISVKEGDSGQTDVAVIEKSRDITSEHKTSSDEKGYLLSFHNNPGRHSLEDDADTVDQLMNKKFSDVKLYVSYLDGVAPKIGYDTISTDLSVVPNEFVSYKIPGTVNELALAEYRGSMETVNIPAEVTGYWTDIRPDDSDDILYKEVVLDNGSVSYYISDDNTYRITRIGADPNQFPPKRSGVTFNTKDGYMPKTIEMSEGIKEIGPYAFSGLSMKQDAKIVIPDSVEIIGSYAFANAGNGNLTDLKLVKNEDSSKLRIIKTSAFSDLEKLNRVSVFTVPKSVVEIGSDAFSNFRMPAGKLVINGASDIIEPDSSINNEHSSDQPGTVHAYEVDNIVKEAVLLKRSFSNITVGSLEIGGIVERLEDEIFKNEEPDENSEEKKPLNIDIKSSVKIGGNVETIGSYAFSCSNFTGDLELGDKVSEIGISAFENCKGFTGSLDLKKVNRIGKYAFRGCENVTGGLEIPSSIVSIGEQAFDDFAKNSEAKSLVIKAGTANEGHTLGGLIFTGANFKDITIEGDVITEISSYAFRNSPYKGKMPYNNFKGSLTITAKNLVRIGMSAFEDCTGFTGSLVLPDNVSVISDSAFVGCCNFRGTLSLPAELTYIGPKAFMECHGFKGFAEDHALENTKIRTIGIQAFKNCMNFEGGLTIPATVTGGIGYCAFENFASRTTYNEDGTGTAGPLRIYAGNHESGTKLGAFIFPGARFNDIIIGGIVNEVDSYAFKNNNDGSGEAYSDDLVDHEADTDHEKTDMSKDTDEKSQYEYKDTLNPDSSVNADYSNFTGSLVFEKGVTKVDDFAFYDCYNLDGNLLFNAVENENGEIEIYEITDSTSEEDRADCISYIGEGAFKNCRNMSGDLIIPESVSLIERCAFKMFGDGSGALVINGGSNGTKLGYVIEDIIKDENGKDERVEVDHPIFPDARFSSLTIGGNISVICNGFMDQSNYLYKLDLENKFHESNMNEIDTKLPADGDLSDSDRALREAKITEENDRYIEACKFLRENYSYAGFTGNLNLGSSVTEIESYAFKQMSFTGGNLSLTSVTSVGKEAFDGCKTLEANLDLPSAHTIGEAAFRDCEKIKGNKTAGDLTLSNVLTIEKSAFENCRSITGKLLIGRCTTIEEKAFRNCERMSGGLTIPASVTRIGTNAFYGFSSALSDDEVTGGLEILGCSGIETMTFEDGTSHKETRDEKVIGASIFDKSRFNGVTIAGNVTTVKANAFKGDSGLKGKLTIGGNVKNIGKAAFSDCSGFTELSLDNGTLYRIYEGAFARCSGVKGGLYIPATVEYMERCAFKEFAKSVSDSEAGLLKIYGSSDHNGNLGNPNLDSDGAPLFSDAKFRGVTIGGKVTKIHHDQFSNKIYYDFGNEIMDINKNPVENPFGEKDNTYNFSEIKGDLTIEEGVTEIGSSAFACVAFDNVIIPKTVTAIGESAFLFAGSGKGSLTVLGTSERDGRTLGGGENYPIFLGGKFNGLTVGGNVKKINDFVFHNRDGNGPEYISEEEKRYHVTTEDGKSELIKEKVIYKYNYNFSGFTGSLEIGPEVEEIGQSAFESCPFDGEFIFEDEANPANSKLKKIGMYAFKNCEKLDGGLIIPPSVQKIDEDAFFHFAAQSDNKGELVLWSGSSNSENKTNAPADTLNRTLFEGASFRNVIIGGNIKYIARDAFSNDDQDAHRTYNNIDGSLYIGAGVAEVGENAFQNCKFDGSLEIGGLGNKADIVGNTSDSLVIKFNAFKECSGFTGDLNIPDKVTGIGDSAFENCTGFDGKLSLGYDFKYDQGAGRVTVSKGVSQIGNSAFKNCSGFTDRIEIPPTLTSVGNHTFENCSGFTGIVLDDYWGYGITSIGDSAFSGCTGATGKLVIPSIVTSIGDYAFYNCSSLTEFEFFDGAVKKLTSIGASAFENCSNMTGELRIFNTVTSIGRAAFKNCSNLYASPLTIPSSVTVLGDDAFMQCTGISGVKIDAQLGSVGNGVFNGCTGLTGSLVIPSSVKSIGAYAFYKCHGLSGTLTIPSGVESIGNYAFYQCWTFSGNLNIPSSVKKIGDYAFLDMGGVTKLILNDGLNEIGSFAFADMRSANGGLTIPGSVYSIGEHAFRNYADRDNTSIGELVIYGASNGTELGNVQIFDGAKFRNVTIGGIVRKISANAFDNSNKNYENITGTISIIPKTVGYKDKDSAWFKIPRYESGAIGDKAFNECKFTVSKFPDDCSWPYENEDMYSQYNNNRYGIFGSAYTNISYQRY